MDGAIWWVLVLVLLLVMLIASWRSTNEVDERDAPGADGLSPPYAHAPGADETHRPAKPPEPGRCPACGTENDCFYTYCRECVTQLP